MSAWAGWPRKPELSKEAVDVLSGYLRALARGDGLDLLPTDRDELVTMATDAAAFVGSRAADVLAAQPPFRVELTGSGDVGALMGGAYVHTWRKADLDRVAQAARAGWQGQYDGDY